MTTTPKAADLAALPVPVLDCKPEWLALYDFAWKTAARNIRHSRGRDHMDAAWDPARNFQWVWDTCFMTLYCRYGNGQYPGIQSLDNFYDLQREDGYISMTYDMTTGVEPWTDRINPPLFAWAEWEYARTTGDLSRLPRVVPHIEKLMGWIDRNRKTVPHRRARAVDNEEAIRGESADTFQLYYFEDGGSSGMDDAPRSPRVKEAGQYMDWIDLSAQMVLSFRMLVRLHSLMGQPAAAEAWETRAVETGKLVNEELWCARTRFYHDRTIPRNFIASKTVAGFWPVLAGLCTGERLDAMVAHLLNPDEFNRAVPVPSLSADDCNYDARGTYWIGGVWAPTNYMVIRGMAAAGREEVAHTVAAKYLDGLARTYREFEPHTLWEANAPDFFKPGLKPYGDHHVKPDFVGWSGIGPIAVLIENILGLDLDAVNRRIGWTIRLPGRQGLRNLVFGGHRADLMCEPAGSGMRITVRTGAPLRLDVRRGGTARTFACPAGESVFDLKD